MRYTYLIINVLTIFFPIVLSFDKRVQFYKSWKFIWPGMLITGVIFLGWDILFTAKGVWSFNPKYITGIKFYGLPLEEIFFFLTVPFACLFIYACLNYYVAWRISNGITKTVSILLMLIALLCIIFFYNRLYTLVTFSLLLFLVTGLQFILKVQWLSRFYSAYLVSLIPFYIVNGILTALPVVMYNNTQNIGKRAGTIPLEDHFYSMALLLLNVGLFEYFSRRRITDDRPARL